ncbi:hypothetical protein DIPPA_30167 [Diplonema papillatum]|nr:hypothetical protein DIPPA_30167 [Diplonema papillatum]
MRTHLAQLGGAIVAGCGILAVTGDETIRKELRSFNYPPDVINAVPLLQIAAGAALFKGAYMGSQLMLFTSGAGCYSVARRAFEADNEFQRNAELAWAVIEGFTFIVLSRWGYGGQPRTGLVRMPEDLAVFGAGACSASGIHWYSGRKPYWIGWDPDLLRLLGQEEPPS